MRTATITTRSKLLGAAACALLLALAIAGSASAKVVELYVYNGNYPGGSFTGADAVGAGAFGGGASNVEINQATEEVFVGANGLIYKFNAAGESKPFSSVAPNTVITQGTYNFGALKIDNSGTATQGRIYAKEEYSDASGYLPSGAPIGGGWPVSGAALGDSCGMDVAPDGGIWFVNYGANQINRYNTNGVSEGGSFSPLSNPCGIAIDSEENIYSSGYGGSTLVKYSKTGTVLDSKFGGENNGGENVAIDRSTNHVFVALSTTSTSSTRPVN